MEKVTMILIFVGVAIALALIASLVVFIFFLKGKKKRTPFMLYNRENPSQFRMVQGTLVVDKKNPNKKYFKIPEIGVNNLEVREATGNFNGKPIREITYDHKHEIMYLTGTTKITNNLAISRVLDNDEKTLALHKYDVFDKRYETGLSDSQVKVMLTMLGLVFVLVIGLVLNGGVSYVTSKQVVEIAAINEETAKEISSATTNIKTISEQQVQITALLVGEGGEIKRNVGS